jgi:hypothetical protein
MVKKLSTSEKIRRMIKSGKTTKEIVAKLQVKPATVYTVRWNMGKAKNTAETGINVPPPRKVGRPKNSIRLTYIPPTVTRPYESVIPTQPRSFWQRVKDWFYN